MDADKQHVVHPYTGILVSLRKEILAPATVWMNREDTMLSDINQSQILYDSTYLRYLE